MDIDLEGNVTTERLTRLKDVLSRVDEYLASVGCRRGVRASTGGLTSVEPPADVAPSAGTRTQLASVLSF